MSTQEAEFFNEIRQDMSEMSDDFLEGFQFALTIIASTPIFEIDPHTTSQIYLCEVLREKARRETIRNSH